MPEFEGPLDLLLFFIKRDELNIYDIPIAKITKEFLDYIHLMQMLDLDVAGEFIVMASTLMEIKAKMLLPREEPVEEEEEDPRAELVRRLLEYKRFKEAAGKLGEFESKAMNIFYRGCYKYDYKDYVDENAEPGFLRDVTLFDLILAFKRAVEKAPTETIHEIKDIPYRIEDEMNLILAAVVANGRVSFGEFIKGYREKIRVIVSFLAILELAKAGKIKLSQSENFGDIIITYAGEGRIADAV